MRLSNYDKRQLGRMLDMLDRFERGEAPIDALISGIDALIALLKTDDASFKTSLHKQWSVLENVYASSLDKRRVPFGGNDRKIIQPALDELRRLLFAEAPFEEE